MVSFASSKGVLTGSSVNEDSSLGYHCTLNTAPPTPPGFEIALVVL
ncbi:hypothetical protein EYZ11_013183 [Aspergillus tanneri]|uniref:Uncharacterized protein n=1 Tax=Aspergillus tanneri TaxID=1220188 RepID=A0A4S3J3R5_9EURO|nr:hypothetical protein EYZ11_013183 [Aspergillus tanneri]